MRSSCFHLLIKCWYKPCLRFMKYYCVISGDEYNRHGCPPFRIGLSALNSANEDDSAVVQSADAFVGNKKNKYQD